MIHKLNIEASINFCLEVTGNILLKNLCSLLPDENWKKLDRSNRVELQTARGGRLLIKYNDKFGQNGFKTIEIISVEECSD